MGTEHNVTQRNLTEPIVTQQSIGKGSDEGETDRSIMLLRYMAQLEGIEADVEKAISDFGFHIAHDAFTAWRENGSVIGTYSQYLKGDNK